MTYSIIELGIFLLFIITFIFLLVSNIRFKIKLSNLTLKLLEERVSKNIIIETAKKEIQKEKNVEQTDGFLKFISESRDLAFSYIEEAQVGIDKFVKGVQPEMEYFNKFGSISEGQPLHDSMVKISKEYEELKKLIPADYGKID
jgi:hypothetical protein